MLESQRLVQPTHEPAPVLSRRRSHSRSLRKRTADDRELLERMPALEAGEEVLVERCPFTGLELAVEIQLDLSGSKPIATLAHVSFCVTSRHSARPPAVTFAVASTARNRWTAAW